MPLLLIGVGVGALGTYFVSDKVENTLKWGVIAVGGYLAYKALKK